MANGFPDKLERGTQETYHTMVPNLILLSVCVKHLNRCKTCTLIYLSAGEWWAFLEPPLNEDTPNFL